MARILIFQHGGDVGPGRLGATLRDHGFNLDIRRVDLPSDGGGKPVPPDLDNVHGVISLGGHQNIDESHPWLQAEIEFIRAAHGANLPVVGVCLGAQLLTTALGGRVAKLDRPAVGFHEVNILPPGQTDTILAGVPWRSMQFHTNAFGVEELPEGATTLASSEACSVEVFKVGFRTYAFQHHFEYDRHMIDRATDASRGLLTEAGMTAEQVGEQADRYYRRTAQINDRLCVNIATYCFPFSRLLAV